MSQIILPSRITEDVWFYEENKEVLKEHLGKYYISYSTCESWNNYKEDMIKQKFVGIEKDSGIYAELGSFVGGYVETGILPSNPSGFKGVENLRKIPRPDNAIYERFVCFEVLPNVIFIGFVDVYVEDEKGVDVCDIKTGSESKKAFYASKDYKQVTLYSHAIELEGKSIKSNYVYFVERTGSHIRLPMGISDKQEVIPLKYNKTRVVESVRYIRKTVKEISELYTIYLKFFK